MIQKPSVTAGTLLNAVSLFFIATMDGWEERARIDRRMIRGPHEQGKTARLSSRILHRRGVQDKVQAPRRIATTAFRPPNANEFDSTARTGLSRATFGT